MDMLFTHDVNYGRQGKEEADGAQEAQRAAAGASGIGATQASDFAGASSQFELNSALAGFFGQPFGRQPAAAPVSAPEPAPAAVAPVPAYDSVPVIEPVPAPSPEPALAPEAALASEPAVSPQLASVPESEPAFAFDPAPQPVFEPAVEPVSQPTFEPSSAPAPQPSFEFEPMTEFAPADSAAATFEPASVQTFSAQSVAEPEVTSIPSLDFSFSAGAQPEPEVQPAFQAEPDLSSTFAPEMPNMSAPEPAPAPAPEPLPVSQAQQPFGFQPVPASDPLPTFEPQPVPAYEATPLPGQTYGQPPQPDAATVPSYSQVPVADSAPIPGPAATAEPSSAPSANAAPAPMPAANLTPQPVFVPETERSEEPEAVQTEKGARRISKVPVLTSQSIPTKRSINLIEATKRRLNKRSIAITTVVAVVILALIGKFGVFDPYSHLAEARSHAAQLQSEVARANLEIEAMGELVETYSHYTYSGMTSDELARTDRAEILEMIERVIMPRATLSSWSVKGDTLTTSITADSLQDINAVAQLVNEEEIVNYCSVVTASNGAMNASGQDSGRVTANIVVYLNPNDEGVRI